MLLPIAVNVFVAICLLFVIWKKYPKREILVVKLCLLVTMITLISALADR